jgi:hypothetical protein
MSLENVDGLQLKPDFGLGHLGGQVYSLIVSNGLATEPEQRAGSILGVIRFTAPGLLPAGQWIVFKTVGTLKIGNSYINFEIKVVASGSGGALIPKQANRLMSSPL